MRKRITSFVLLSSLLTVGLAFSPAAAQELQNTHWGPAIGLTENDTLRVTFIAGSLRVLLPGAAESTCDVEVIVDVLAPDGLRLLASSGRVAVKVGGPPLYFEYTAKPGPQPAREEVILRTTIVRQPGIASERMVLGNLCPLIGSGDVFDSGTGMTRFINYLIQPAIQK